ncbi:hypothetical protein LMH87_004770 [Akanthomyces muscarius]|uniref:DNA/RNA-binding protein Alba-like domain-containing protein n=1 Tax=Akanthomyces muscarius TaxID=2231603 RepID=A0A9W8Q4G0_AKAMU|nr:hypothetical protein LMH87_004770 [Akanthomyces muscarius]KAJ4145939.1 hypothetical protein LMH87_004770 [Akanthomyces muscarius]
MPAAEMDLASKKRKPSTSIDNTAKKPRPANDATSPPQAQDSPLYKPHASALQALAAKYDVLPASVISSTPIRKRLVHITTHLLGTTDGQNKPRAVLLYARTAEVCKMITVAEKCKRLLEEQGQATWYQYNQLFDLSREDAARGKKKEKKKKKKKKRVVEETVLHVEEADEEEEEDDESDAFETMQSRFEKAVLPQATDRTTKSLRIFLSTTAIPELKAKEGVTVQTSVQ